MQVGNCAFLFCVACQSCPSGQHDFVVFVASSEIGMSAVLPFESVLSVSVI